MMIPSLSPPPQPLLSLSARIMSLRKQMETNIKGSFMYRVL